MTFNLFDVVSVPFPFTDSERKKRRPALVLSSQSFNNAVGHSIMAMITSAKNKPWPLDSKIQELEQAGLKAESVIRMKLFTLDHRFVIAKLGTLGKKDQESVCDSLTKVMKELIQRKL